MKSMTGFGRGTAVTAGVRATVDIRTVNHRFLDLKVRGVPLAPAVEEAVATRIRAVLERGAVSVTIHVTREGAAAGPAIDVAVAERVHRQLADLAARLGMAPPELAVVLAQPGVLVTQERTDDDPPVLPALDAALAQLGEMRIAEGAALAAELTARLDTLTALRVQVATVAATVPHQLTRRLHERVRRLLEDVEVEPARLAQEVALLADRSDVTEELVRLASHLDQARALVAGPGSAGRRLDFLIQEIGRELNTIGSKSAVTEISTAIVEGKAVLEKIREQVQNVE